MTKVPKDISKVFDSKNAKINDKFKSELKSKLFQEEIMATKPKKSNSSVSFIKKYNLGPVLAVMFMVLFVGSASAAVTTSRVNQSRNQEIELPSDLASVLSIDDIRAIAVAEITDATVTGIELEREDGVLVYKVKFSDGSFILYDANSGEKLNKNQLEVDESVPAGFVAGISLQDARTIAQNERSGATITKIELEVEDGIVVYSVRFSDGDRVIIDATNGTIIISSPDNSSSSDSSDDDSNESEDSDDDSSEDSGDDESDESRDRSDEDKSEDSSRSDD